MNQISSQVARLSDMLRSVNASGTQAALTSAIQHPSENAPLLLIVVAAVVVAVVLLVVCILLLVTPSTKKVVKRRTYHGAKPEGFVEGGQPRVVAAPPVRPPSKVFLALTSPIAITALVVLGLVGMYAGTSTNEYCGQTCHAHSPASASAQGASHATCVSCHEARLVLGFAPNLASRAKMLVDYSMGASAASATVVMDSGACLRCHGAIRSGVTQSAAGVRMQHKDVIAAGQPCDVCHAGTGHAKVDFTGKMAACLPCHDGKTASAACSTCHAKDPGSMNFASATDQSVTQAADSKPLGSGRMVYPAVRSANRDCGVCHTDQAKTCDPCHGIRMPHSAAFIEGAHARAAAFDGKVTRCWKCHDPVFCGNAGCHHAPFYPDTGNTTHGNAWKQQHKNYAWDSGCICHSQRSARTAPICTLCHDPETHALLPITQ